MRSFCLTIRKKIKKYRNHKESKSLNPLILKEKKGIADFNRIVYKVFNRLKKDLREIVIYKNKQYEKPILASFTFKKGDKLVFFNLLPGFNLIYGEKIGENNPRIEVYYEKDEDKLFEKAKKFFKK